MGWHAGLYGLAGVGAAVIMAIVALKALRNRSQRGSIPLVVSMVIGIGWALTTALQPLVPNPALQRWLAVAGIAISGSIATAFLWFGIEYGGYKDRLTDLRATILVAEPVVFGLLTITYEFHSLVIIDVSTQQIAGASIPALQLGGIYYFQLLYSYVLITIVVVLFLLVILGAPAVYHKQTGLMIAGILPALVVNLSYHIGIRLGPLPQLDHTPYAFAITGVLFAIALFEYDLLDRTPAASRRVLEDTGVGLLVFDAKGNLEETNQVGQRVLGGKLAATGSIADIVDRGVADIESALTEYCRSPIETTVSGRQRFFDPSWTRLTDHRETTIGYALTLQEVTSREEYEQRMEVVQRVLRHNIRTELSVVLGQAQTLADRHSDGVTDHTEIIEGAAEDLLTESEKVRLIQRIDGYTSAERVPLDGRELLEELLEDYRERFPAATIEADLTDRVPLYLPSEELLRIPVRNVLDNAIEHNESDLPWVELSVNIEPDYTVIRVADDGPPIPEIEREVLTEGEENPLEHGSGMGLWLVYWSLTAVGGKVNFERKDDPPGNVVTLSYPIEK